MGVSRMVSYFLDCTGVIESVDVLEDGSYGADGTLAIFVATPVPLSLI